MKGAASHHDALIEMLRESKRFREAYMNEALNEEDGKLSLLMLSQVAEAMGGMTKLSKLTGLNRQNLHRTFSGKRDPAFSTVEGIVHGLGFRFKVEEAKSTAAHERPAAYQGKKPLTDKWIQKWKRKGRV